MTALQFVIGLYRSSLVGLQRQVQLNLVNCIMATFRSVGAVAVLIWVSPTISAFFIWQGIASLLTLILFIRSTYMSQWFGFGCNSGGPVLCRCVA